MSHHLEARNLAKMMHMSHEMWKREISDSQIQTTNKDDLMMIVVGV